MTAAATTKTASVQFATGDRVVFLESSESYGIKAHETEATITQTGRPFKGTDLQLLAIEYIDTEGDRCTTVVDENDVRKCEAKTCDQYREEIEDLKEQLAKVKAAHSKRNAQRRTIDSRNADLKEEIAAIAAKGVTSFDGAVANIDKIADLAEKIWHLPSSFAPASMFN